MKLTKKALSAGDKSSHLAELLEALANYLVDAGIGISTFENLAQRAYLNAAIAKARLGNSRVNQSAVSAMTGLSRAQVRALLRDKSKPASQSRDYVDGLIDGWTSDPRFATRLGGRVLALSGKDASFEMLVKAYGGDIPRRALIKAMSRRNLIEVDAATIRLKSRPSRLRVERDLKQLAAALAASLRPARDSGPKVAPTRTVFTELSYESPDAIGQVLLARRVRQGLDAFQADLKSAAEAVVHSGRRRQRSARHASKLSVIVLQQD